MSIQSEQFGDLSQGSIPTGEMPTEIHNCSETQGRNPTHLSIQREDKGLEERVKKKDARNAKYILKVSNRQNLKREVR